MCALKMDENAAQAGSIYTETKRWDIPNAVKLLGQLQSVSMQKLADQKKS